MGNSPAGSRLDSGGSGAAGGRRLVEIEVINHLGLPFALVQETFSSCSGGGSMVEVPKAVSSSGVLRIHGQAPAGHAVFVSSLSFSQAAPKEIKIAPKHKALKSKVTDLRDQRAEQFLAIWARSQPGGWLRSDSLAFGAVYGAFEGAGRALGEAESVATASNGEWGLCSWQVSDQDSSDDAFRVLLEVRKPQASSRSALLDSLETRSAEEEAAAAFARQEAVLLRHTQDQEYQLSLLQDQLRDLLSRQEALRAELGELQEEAERSEAELHMATQRLERFGENPRLREEASKLEASLAELGPRKAEAEQELSELEGSILQKSELLAAMLGAGD